MSRNRDCELRIADCGLKKADAARRQSEIRNPKSEIGRACSRGDLDRWSTTGGPLPVRLAEHVLTCPGCADAVRRFSQVHMGLQLLCTQAPPVNLPARANGRALRFLRKAARASAAASRLLRMRPDLTPTQRAYVHLTRMSVTAAAALLTLVMRTGVIRGFEHTSQLRQELTERYWDKRVDPAGEWTGPRPIT